jgi:hypothetical protein
MLCAQCDIPYVGLWSYALPYRRVADTNDFRADDEVSRLTDDSRRLGNTVLSVVGPRLRPQLTITKATRTPHYRRLDLRPPLTHEKQAFTKASFGEKARVSTTPLMSA